MRIGREFVGMHANCLRGKVKGNGKGQELRAKRVLRGLSVQPREGLGVKGTLITRIAQIAQILRYVCMEGFG